MHAWDLKPKEAIELQKKLRDEVRLIPLSSAPKLIGGADVSMNRFAKEGYAGFVTLSYPELTVVDHRVEKGIIPFPYVPELLSFREIPMLMTAWKKLQTKPDLLVVDGIGIAHPRRLGIASHLGLLLNIPTIGCAKSVLIGAYDEPGDETGATSPLVDLKTGEVMGMALRTKRSVKPVFVSPGHLITLEEAVEIVERCVIKHRLPEPTRLAHNTVNEYRLRDILSAS